MEEKHATANDWQALISKLGGVFSAHVVFSESQSQPKFMYSPATAET